MEELRKDPGRVWASNAERTGDSWRRLRGPVWLDWEVRLERPAGVRL